MYFYADKHLYNKQILVLKGFTQMFKLCYAGNKVKEIKGEIPKKERAQSGKLPKNYR